MRVRGVIAMLAMLPPAAIAADPSPANVTLADVKRVYVEQLGGGKTSDQFRDMMIAALQSSGLFLVTENAERADAILKGSGDDLIYSEEHNSSDSLGIHANTGSGSSSRALDSGVSSNQSMGIGVTDSESNRSQERRHEATGSVRLVGRDGDILWSTTQESNGGKFRSAMADVADKIVRQLIGETRRMREQAEARQNPPLQSSDVKPLAPAAKENAAK
jgi:hypothetical protein